MTQRPFVILDRDGTMIVERNYLSQPDEVELIPGTAEGLRELQNNGFGLLVVSNQSGVGRGYFNEASLEIIHQRLISLLSAEGISLDGIYYCPHTPEDDCRCRKPQPQLVRVAAAELEFDPRQSFVIGDKPCDIDLGKNVGATTILVRSGYGQQTLADGTASPDYVADDVSDAARIIKGLTAANENRMADATPCLP